MCCDSAKDDERKVAINGKGIFGGMEGIWLGVKNCFSGYGGKRVPYVSLHNNDKICDHLSVLW